MSTGKQTNLKWKTSYALTFSLKKETMGIHSPFLRHQDYPVTCSIEELEPFPVEDSSELLIIDFLRLYGILPVVVTH